MAGSYKHCVTKVGKVLSADSLKGMIENLGDAYEAIEEMVFMISFLSGGNKLKIENALRAFYAYPGDKSLDGLSEKEIANVRQIPLSGMKSVGKFALVDKEDFEKISAMTWRINSYGYAITKKKYIWMHRVVMNCPSHLLVDHKNGNTLDNRKCNLRLVDKSQNNLNRRMSPQNTSGYRGIVWSKGFWEARLQYKRKFYYGGRFETKEEAAKAYDALAIIHHGEFAQLNFPEEL